MPAGVGQGARATGGIRQLEPSDHLNLQAKLVSMIAFRLNGQAFTALYDARFPVGLLCR